MYLTVDGPASAFTLIEAEVPVFTAEVPSLCLTVDGPASALILIKAEFPVNGSASALILIEA